MMMGASNLMMGLTLVLVVCLAVVLGLVLVLLAELYCSILLRRRDLPPITTTTTTTAEDTHTPTTFSPPPLTTPPSLNTFGVLSAPRNILYPSLPTSDVESQKNPPPRPEIQETGRKGGGGGEEDLVYISNPMYENGRRSRVGNTPFETPDTSPSRLEAEGSSGDDEREEVTSLKVAVTPPLTPMKKLPAEVKGGGGGGGELESNNGVSSSSSSGTPCTSSLSW